MLEDTRQTSLCKPVSKTILLGCENGSFPSLFDCHLAISQSSTACYTSFKRGDSGLPADVKIRTIFQLIGIVWSYFLRISRYQCIYICICIQTRIQIVSKYLVSFPSLIEIGSVIINYAGNSSAADPILWRGQCHWTKLGSGMA